MLSLVEMTIFRKIASYIKTCFAERGENDHFAATPCIIVFYSFILLNCSHIVATTEYFESTRRYCYPKCALAFLGFKSTKK